MKTKRIEMIEKEITTWKCDFCDKESEGNQGCCGTRPIMECKICDKDICYDHRHFYTEDDWSDYPHGFYACTSCKPEADKAWEYAEAFASRHEDIVEKAMEWYTLDKETQDALDME